MLSQGASMLYKPVIRPVNFEIVKTCHNYLKHNNIANRGVYDGNKEKQLVGLVGEMETHKLLKGYYPDLDLKEKGFDGGYDIVHANMKIDVKTMARKVYTRDYYANNFTALQKNFNPDILLFTSINKKTNQIEFCGWIWKNDLENKAKLYKKGSVRKRGLNDSMTIVEDNYEILCSKLNRIEDLLY